MRQHLDKSLEENSSLKALLSSMKKEVKNAEASAALNLQIGGEFVVCTTAWGNVRVQTLVETAF